jgi:ureidoglycolate dehydrogenase (NAD+)
VKPEVLDRPHLRPYCTNDNLFFGTSPHTEVVRDQADAAPPVVTGVPGTGFPAPRREHLLIGEDEARVLTRAALAGAGLCATDAQHVADALVDTSLRGLDTQGLRLLPRYLDDLATGVADATATPRIVSDRGAGVLVDAAGALGVVAGMAAAHLAARRAAKFGVAGVGVRNGNDFGAASVYTRQLARDGLVGIAVSSTDSGCGVHSVQPLFGTSPVAEVLDDECTSDLTSGQADGLAAAGALLGLVLTGAPLLGQPAGQSRRVGQLLIALDPVAFGGHADLGVGLADLLDDFRAERDSQRTHLPQAIPLDDRTADVLAPLAEDLGIPGPRWMFAE